MFWTETIEAPRDDSAWDTMPPAVFEALAEASLTGDTLLFAAVTR